MLNLFSSKRNIGKTTLLQGMTEIHCHLLPGVDDGVQTVDESLSCLLAMNEVGVRRLYLTPHMMEELPQNNRAFLQEQFEALQKVCPAGMELRLSSEYMLDGGFTTHLAEGLLPMGGKYILVETSYLSPPPDFQKKLYQLALEGYTPILAHPERYMYMEKRDYNLLKQQGYMFQLNLFSLTGVYGSIPKKKTEYLLDNGCYDFVGSDLHHAGDYPNRLGMLMLSRSQESELERLIANNNRLW